MANDILVGTLVTSTHFAYIVETCDQYIEEKGSSSHFKMLAFLSLLGFGLIQCSDDAYLTRKMSATSGPESDDVYQPGTPGGAWTDEEVATTRRRIFQMIHPDWDVKKDMYTYSLRTLRDQVTPLYQKLHFSSFCIGSHHGECALASSLP